MPGACVNQYGEPGAGGASTIDNKPRQLTGSGIPAQKIHDLHLGLFAEEFLAPVLLRHFKGFIGVHLQKSQVPWLSRAIVGIKRVFNAVVYPVGIRTARPGKRFRLAAGS